jgi:branched-chain amino acid transport system permease protein
VFAIGAWSGLLVAGLFGLTAISGGAPPVAGIWVGPVVLIAAMVICGILGFLIERLAYRPLRSAPRLNVLITAIGVSLLLQNLGQLNFIFGTQPRAMPNLLAGWSSGDALFRLFGARIALVDVVAATTAVVLMIALELLIHKTRIGRAMRAVAHNHQTAALMGINVNRIISFTFVLGSVLAAAAGVLYASKYTVLNQPAFNTWILLGLKAFVAAVIGGIGNVQGAMLGGLLIGLTEQFGATYISTELRDVYVFAILIIVLIACPQGLLGRNRVEKV